MIEWQTFLGDFYEKKHISNTMQLSPLPQIQAKDLLCKYEDWMQECQISFQISN